MFGKVSKLSHAQNRAKVCLLCFEKGSSMTVISGLVLNRVKNHFLTNYNPNDQKFPNGICARCRNLLINVDRPSDDAKRVESSDLPDVVDFSKLQFPVITRSSGSLSLGELVNCTCDICKKATENAVSTPGRFAGPGQGRSHEVGRPPLHTVSRLPDRKPVTICQRCAQVVGRGIPHDPNCSITNRRENVHAMLMVDPRGREIEAANLIKEKLKLNEAAGTSSPIVPLATNSGKSYNVQPQPKASTSKALYHGKPIPEAEWQKVTLAATLTGAQRRIVERGLRPLSGRNLFEPRIDQAIRDKNKEGSEFFDIAKRPMDPVGQKDDEKALTTIFYCKDLPGLTKFIERKRGYHERTDRIQLFGFDKGGTSLKKVFNLKKVENDFSSPHGKKKATYSQGPLPNSFTDGGVNRTIVIGYAEKVKETYHNLKEICTHVDADYNDLDRPFDTNDLKLTPAFLGIGPASSTYPCHCCEMKKIDFGKIEVMLKGGELRTLGSIKANARGYQEALLTYTGKKKMSSAPWKNCENMPLYDFNRLSELLKIIDMMPPPELHMLLGLGNDFFDLLRKRLTTCPRGIQLLKDFCLKWNLERVDYYGSGEGDGLRGQFAGNGCKTLLDHVDGHEGLVYFLSKDAEALQLVQPILDAMRAFNVVRKQCFGVILDANYKDSIKTFANLWIKCERSITLKCHVLFVHVVHFLERNAEKYPGKGLGFWGEQAAESIHSKWETFWARRKVPTTHKDYDKILFWALVEFNATHYGNVGE